MLENNWSPHYAPADVAEVRAVFDSIRIEALHRFANIATKPAEFANILCLW